jgi:hypothetical protein
MDLCFAKYEWINSIYEEIKAITEEVPMVPLVEGDYATLQHTPGTGAFKVF